MTHKEKALEYFGDKFHCSQSVIAAFAEECGLTEEKALKLGACFGGGMRKGEVCGACTGVMERFAQKCGSYICKDLLKCDISTQEGVSYALENKLFTEFCPEMVANAVDILEEIIKEQN